MAHAARPGQPNVAGREHWTGKGDVRLFLWEKPASRPGATRGAILFVHGSSMASTPTFDLQVPGRSDSSAMDYFAGRGFDTWCVDLEGYGRSSKHRAINCDIANGADDLAAASDYILRTRGCGPLLVYGISSGALRAALFAQRHPDRVRRLALDAFVWTGEGSPTLAERRTKLPQFQSANRRPIDHAFVRSIFTRDHPGTADDSTVEAFAEAILALDESIPTGTYVDMCSKLPVVDPERIIAPTIVMRGQYDGIAGLDDGSNSSNACPTRTSSSRSCQGLPTRASNRRTTGSSITSWRRSSPSPSRSIVADPGWRIECGDRQQSGGLDMTTIAPPTSRLAKACTFGGTRRSFLRGSAALGLGALAGGFGRARAAAFPSRTIEVIVPTREGGGADRNLRAVTDVWSKYLEGAVFEPGFYPGASGRAGYEVYMGKREPNPHNLLFGNVGPEVLNWVVEPPESFQFPGDYKYFAHVDNDPSVVYVSADGPFQTIEDVVEEGKKRTLSVAVSRLAHPASLGVLALGEAAGAKFNLIPFSGGRNTIAAVVTGETDLGALPIAGVIERGDVLKVVLLFDDQNRFGDKLPDVPVVNEAFGTDLPPLVSSRAFALHSATFEQYPEEVAMLQESLRQVFDDPQHEQNIVETGAPAEVIAYGGMEECEAYVENIIAIGNRFKPLLTGDTDDG